VSLSETLHLLQAVKLGDSHARDDLFTRHAGRLAGFIRVNMSAELRARVAPEDILQETLFEAARKLEAFEPQGPAAFYSWLVEIARYKLAEARRAGRALKRAKQTPLDSGVDLGVTSTPSRHAERGERAEQLAAALERIDATRAEAVRLRYLEGLSVADAAERMDCSETALKSRVARGLSELADRL
jgi:RNA polymerase sigma-70 factor (ECF subfamily)